VWHLDGGHSGGSDSDGNNDGNDSGSSDRGSNMKGCMAKLQGGTMCDRQGYVCMLNNAGAGMTAKQFACTWTAR
jgi:hypothetical protein